MVRVKNFYSESVWNSEIGFGLQLTGAILCAIVEVGFCGAFDVTRATFELYSSTLWMILRKALESINNCV